MPIPCNRPIYKDNLRREIEYARDNGLLHWFEASCKTHGVELYYALAVASQESGIGMHLPSDGLGGGGEWGVMQINIGVHGSSPNFRAVSPLDHKEIIDYGVRHLRELRTSQGSAYLSFLAYNAGPDCRSDSCTTCGSYGRDVTQRSLFVRQILEEGDTGGDLPVPNMPPGDVVLPPPDTDYGDILEVLSETAVEVAGVAIPWWLVLAAFGAGAYTFSRKK